MGLGHLLNQVGLNGGGPNMNPDGGNPANDAAGGGDEDHERYGHFDFPELFGCIGNIAQQSENFKS